MNPESIVASPDEMISLGGDFASGAKAGDVFGLVGDLGTGKTQWTKGFLETMQPDAWVTSPTFALVNEYREGDPPVCHFDFYRLKSAEELVALGWDEYLDEGGITICEWADRFPAMMPESTRWLRFLNREDGSRSVEEIAAPDR